MNYRQFKEEMDSAADRQKSAADDYKEKQKAKAQPFQRTAFSSREEPKYKTKHQIAANQ